MNYKLVTLPFNVMPALWRMSLLNIFNRFAYRPLERDLVVIPYRNGPVAEIRSRLNSLSVTTRWTIAAPFLLLSIIFNCLALSSQLGQIHNASQILFLITYGGCALAVAWVIYLLFGVKDVILTDQLSLVVPTVWLWPEIASTKGSKYRQEKTKDKEHSRATLDQQDYLLGYRRIFWSELVELSVVDRPDGTGQTCFYLRLERKSGLELYVPLRNIPKESIALLAREIEKNAPFCRNLSQMAEVGRFQDYQDRLLPGVTYDQLWESLTTKTIGATSFAPLKPNCKLQNGRLTIVRQIASGGFSAVYLTEEADGAKFILKEFVLPFGADQEIADKAGEHFSREARFLKALRHKQIARVYDHFIEESRNYLLIEYIRGRSLRQLVFEEGPQAAETVLSFAIQIAEILEYLHRQPIPIIHRDLTPENLIVSEYGTLFLIDFGSANEFVGAATGTLVGKHAYMPPEQIRGKATPSSDIYALGQTIYYCLTACEPKALMTSSLARSESALAKKVDEIIRRCTELEAERRMTLTEVVEALLAVKNEAAK
jgi:tRNA A-37 threonylcarbamoyl transferase component Bud32